MANFSTLRIGMDYNIRSGPNNVIHWNLRTPMPSDRSDVQYRNFVVECTFGKSGGEAWSGISVTLFRPADGVDKWSLPEISDNAILPPPFEHAEIHTDKPGSQYDLVKWRMKYWQFGRGADIGNIGMLDSDTGWPGARVRQTIAYNIYSDEHYEPSGYWTFKMRVADTLDAYADKYLLQVSMYKGRRQLIWMYPFIVQGAAVGEGDLMEVTYLPISIVYAPPGQDMTNSMIESESHGTRMTFGKTYVAGQATTSGLSLSAGLSIGIAGVRATWEESATHSQIQAEASSNVLEITKTQETMITANNQRAIGGNHRFLCFCDL